MDSAFTIRSTELRDYSVKHHCAVVEVLSGAPGRERLLVEVAPPIPGYLYNRREDLELIAITPRHEGVALLPQVSEWPCRVHMMVPEEGSEWEEGRLRILDWGIIEPVEG